MTKQNISIIVPFYNTDKELMDRCISSIINQTSGDFECIIVDDGSNEKYASEVNTYSELDNRISVLHKTNGGLGSARNYGTQHASGEYILYVDSDDYISPYTLQIATDIAENNEADMIIGGLKHVEPTETPVFPKESYRIIKIESREDKVRYIQHLSGCKNEEFVLEDGHTGASACAKIVRTEVAKNVLFENDKFWDEDNLWNISFVAKCGAIIIADVLWYAYVINPSSMVRGYAGDRIYEFQFRAKQEYERIMRLWPECIQGAYYHIWDGMLRYCRTDTFQPNNPNTPYIKYTNFCKAIDFAEFKETVANIDFSYDHRFKYRLVKDSLKRALQCQNKLIAYMILQIVIKTIKF